MDFRKSRYAMLLVIITCYSSLSFAATAAKPVMYQAERPIERELALFGPAAATLTAVGFQPKGKVTVFPREEVQGIDQIRVEVEGLPANTAFTIFLSELNTVPFGSLQYIAEVSTDNAGRGSVTARLVVREAFALRTELNPVPPPVFATPISVDLNHIVLWFGDSSADDPFTTAGAGPFDSDRDSGVAVLTTIEPLP
jgi:hypothetical protein